jgi:hypothetical protein
LILKKEKKSPSGSMQTAPAIDLTTMNYLLYEKRRWNWGRMGQNASIASRKKNLKNKARNKRAFE